MNTTPPIPSRDDSQALLAAALATSHSVLVLQGEAEERESVAKHELARQLTETAQARQALQGLLEEQKRVEAELREQQRYLDSLVSNLPGMAYRCLNDADWTMVYVSGACRELTGYEKSDLEENRVVAFASLVHPDDREWLWEKCQVSLAARTACNNEYRIINRAGAVRWVWERASGVYGADGGLLLIEGFVTDITDRKATEAALRESEARWRFAMDGAGDGLWDWNVETGNVFYSRRWKGMLGYADEELGNSLSVWEQLVHPDDLPAATTALAIHFAGGLAPHAVEHRMRCRDGSWKWILSRGKVVEWSAPGKPRRMLGTHTDIDQAKRQEQVQEALVRRLDLVMRASHIGVWEMDMATGRLEWDDGMHALYGVGRDEFTGSPEEFRRCVHPDDIARVDRTFQDLGEGSPIQLIEFRIVRRSDGKTRMIEGNGYLLRHGEGTPHRLLGMNRDITEIHQAELNRRQLEAQLSQAQKMETLGTLAGGIAHDFNNLLTGIIGCIELSLPVIGSNPKAADLLDRARGAGFRARDLVKRLMLFSRCAPHIGRKPLQLRQMIDETLPILIASLPSSIVIHSHKNSATGDVMGDYGQIQQVLMNLCLNAGYAIGAKQGRITLDLRPAEITAADGLACAAGSYACLCVADDGSGMDEATQARIFDPFFTTKPEGQGTGLGLAIVHGIVHDHGGAIRLRSAPGQGTCFEVYLPVTSGPLALPEAKPAALPKLSGAGCRVLLVDDEEAVRSFVSTVLTMAGFQVEMANDGRDGANHFAATPDAFDFALVDLSMPGRNGFELIGDIRRIRPGLPVILMSGDHHRYDAAGVSPVREKFIALAKPFSIEELKAAVLTALASGPTRHQ